MPAPYDSQEKFAVPVSAAYGLLFLLAFLLCYVAYMYAVRTHQEYYESSEYVAWQYSLQHSTATRDQALPLLVVGDSGIKAGFLARQTSSAAENLALGGTTPLVGFAFLQRYLAHNEAPHRVVISYSPYHLLWQDTFWERAVRFGVVNRTYFRELQQAAEELNDPMLDDALWWKYQLNPGAYIANLKRGLRTARWRQYAPEYAALSASGGHQYFGTRAAAHRGNAETRAGEFRPSPLLDRYLRKMIQASVAAGSATYLITPPFSELSCAQLAPGFIAQFSDYIEQLRELGLSGVTGIECRPNADFGDAAHLYRGAQQFTHDLLREVGLD